MHTRFIPVVAVALLLLTLARARALAPASHFSDQMVLQRDVEVPIWGRAAPGAEISVTFACPDPIHPCKQ